MLQKRKKEDQTLDEFIVDKIQDVRMILEKYNALPSTIVLQRHWRYLGHCFRNTLPEMRALLHFRNPSWWPTEREPSSRVKHRTS
eukprot:10193789-Karenia_brevis.AAC.1